MYICTSEAADGATYSCDKLVLGFRARGRDCGGLVGFLTCDALLQRDAWFSHRIGTYRDQFRVWCGGGNSFWVGCGLNSGGRVSKDIRIEFNPNKVGRDPEFLRVWRRLRVETQGRAVLVRWDLAADYAVPREGVVLVKDRRMYEEIRHSDADRTQYLGQRNKSGRCKLYNKALERGSANAWTRLEISLSLEDSDPDRVAALWPVVYGLQGGAAALVGLPDTDAFLVRTLLEQPERICELGRRKREKLAPILDAARQRLGLDMRAYLDVLKQVSRFLWGDEPGDPVEYTPALGEIDPWAAVRYFVAAAKKITEVEQLGFETDSN